MEIENPTITPVMPNIEESTTTTETPLDQTEPVTQLTEMSLDQTELITQPETTEPTLPRWDAEVEQDFSDARSDVTMESQTSNPKTYSQALRGPKSGQTNKEQKRRTELWTSQVSTEL